MQFITTKTQIASAVKSASSVAPSKSTMPIVTNLLMRKVGDTLTFTASDLEIEMHYRVAIDGDDFAVTVPAKKFAQIISAMQADAKISMQLTDGKLLVKAGKSRFNLATLPADDYPDLPEYTAHDAVKFRISQRALLSALGSVMHAIAAQDIRVYLNGALFESARTLTIVGTDGHRMAAFDTGEQVAQMRRILPRKACEELLRQLKSVDDVVSVEFNDRYAVFDFGNLVLKSKLIDGNFPDWSRVLPKNNNNLIVADRQSIIDAINRTAILANDRLNGMQVKVAGNMLHLACKNADGEESSDEIEISHDGSEIEAGFNFQYLRDALSAIDGDVANIAMSDDGKSAALISGNSGNLRCVVMPMRV